MVVVDTVVAEDQIVIRGEKGIAGGQSRLTIDLALVGLAKEEISVGKAPFFLRAAVLVAEEKLTLLIVSLRIFG